MDYVPSQDAPIWLPGVAAALRQDYRSLPAFRRFAQTRYGSQRWITNDPDAPLTEVGTIVIGSFSATLEDLPIADSASFAGIELAEVGSEHTLDALQSGADVLRRVDGLADTVGCLVEVIHLLHASPGHDVSHTTPVLPFSVFLSVPRPTESSVAIRIAESLLHEAMHLQLTLIDRARPLASAVEAKSYSPWRQSERPVLGVLHGLYVFAVIHEAMGVIADHCDEWRSHCIARRASIQSEVDLLTEQPQGLSSSGNAIWQACRNSVLKRHHLF